MEQKAEPEQNLLKSKQVLEMITIANDFTLFVEKADEYPRDQVLTYLQRILPVIYLKASLLPEIVVTDEDAIEHYVTEEQWETVFNSFRAKLGAEDPYLYIDLHEKSQHDAIQASISENIADLYQDLKDFLILYQKPIYTFQENAVKECRKLFETRYGYRLVNCHKAIHYLIYPEVSSGDLPNYDDIL